MSESNSLIAIEMVTDQFPSVPTWQKKNYPTLENLASMEDPAIQTRLGGIDALCLLFL